MSPARPEILYFGPSDAGRSSLAGYSRDYAAALRGNKNVDVVPVLDPSVPERLDGAESGLRPVKREVVRSLKSGGALENQILHAEIGPLTKREFWAAHYAARLRPRSPLCVVFHDPPNLTPPVRPPAPPRKSGFLERFITNVSQNLSVYGQTGVEEAFLRRISVFLSLSRRGCRLLAERHPAYRHKIAYLPPVCTGPIPQGLEPNRKKVTDVVEILVFGFLRPDKAIEEVVEALMEVHRVTPLVSRARLRIRGIVPEDKEAKKFTKDLAERIRKLGARWLVDFNPGLLGEKDVDQLLRETDVLVLPYSRGSCNGESITLLRAQAWGVAVIASDAGCLGEMIEHGRQGILYPPGDVNALAQALMDLLKDPQRRVELAAALRERALRDHSPDRVSSIALDLYREALAARDQERPFEAPAAMRFDEGGENE
ncbi:MAG TPA: glycosyltransferase family 4 protein [Sumerlaeia bacterium]|nr:glycosyltransferase family 4 protein [Sumerlaeia bacterium]